MKNILFVCTAKLQRSPTAEKLINSSSEFNQKYKAKSAGTHLLSFTKISSGAIKWADLIIVMEEKHKEFILKKFNNLENKKIINLGILNIYRRNDPELISILKEKFKEILK